MKRNSSTIRKLIILLAFSMIATSATAQFKKPLTSSRDKAASINDARFNVGLVGGGDFTTWIHIQNSQSADWGLQPYKPELPQSIGYFGGIALEYMLGNNLSIGLNAVYAKHNMCASVTNERYPYGWNSATQSMNYGTKTDTIRATYSNMEVYLPITYYISLSAQSSFKPYLYAAPRVSYMLPIKGQNQLTHTSITPNSASVVNTIELDQTTYQCLNLGATLGIGARYKINTANYYFLVKLDISANLNALSTYTRADLINEFNNLRYDAYAYASLTFQLPVKKQMKGACVNWGEYD